MKKTILLLTLSISGRLFAQIPEDAIRYSWYPTNGTARNMAIGGAMGSLGGDITATFTNPAGLGFYKTGELVLTPGFLLNNNKANFRGTNTTQQKNAFGIGASGWIIGFGDKNNQKRSSAISIAFNQSANFNNSIHYVGLNNYSSFSEQFAEEFAKSGYSINDVLTSNSVLPYTAAPALYTYLIDTVTVTDPSTGLHSVQVKAAPEYILDAGQALRQEMFKTTKGGIYELAFGYAQNYNDKWFFGASLGIPLVYYKSNTIFTETDTSSNNSNHFNSFTYTDDFKTSGAGANVKLGVIYRPQDRIRLGLAIQTPTLMYMIDKRSTSLSTHLENKDTSYYTTSNTFTNDQPGESKYVQMAPLKIMLSASYVFREIADVKKQRAFITADIEYVQHSGSRFKSENEEPTDQEKSYYSALNKVVKNYYKGSFNFRLGGELKFNTIMGRLGFAYYSNPYRDKTLKADQMLLSGGLGYRNKGFFIDLTYVHNMTRDVSFPYRLADRANTYAGMHQTRGNIVATLGFKF